MGADGRRHEVIDDQQLDRLEAVHLLEVGAVGMRPGAVELHEHVRHARVGDAVQVSAGRVPQRLAQVALPAARLGDYDEHLVVLDPLAAGVAGDAVAAELPVGQVDDVLHTGGGQLEAGLAVELGNLALPSRRCLGLQQLHHLVLERHVIVGGVVDHLAKLVAHRPDPELPEQVEVLLS